MKYIFVLLCLMAAIRSNAQSDEKGMPFKSKKQEITGVIAPAKNATTDTEIYTFVDEIPKPKYDLMLYFTRHMRYPYEAKKDGIEGRVMVRFVVNKDGSFSNFEIMRGVNPALNEEAIRVLKTMPKWRPGKMKGVAVRCSYVQPFTFSRTD